jgi:hypothetical protein
MLHAGEDAAYIYVFARIVSAFVIVISAVTGNDVTVREPSKGIVSETAYVTLILAVAQAKSSFIDLMAA